jgi:hypothetical protein
MWGEFLVDITGWGQTWAGQSDSVWMRVDKLWADEARESRNWAQCRKRFCLFVCLAAIWFYFQIAPWPAGFLSQS